MLRNNNVSFINTLSKSCMRANKIRNVIAVFAIVLTAVLFTSVGTVMEGSMQTIKEQQLYQSGTRFMMSIKYITEEASEKFLSNPAFSEIGKMQFLGYLQEEKLKKITTQLMWAEETLLDGFYVKLTDGRYPEKDNEVMMDTTVLNLLGLPEKAGTIVPISYMINDELREKEVVIAGVYQGDSKKNTSMIYCSRDFLEKELEGIPAPLPGEAASGSILLYGSFSSERNLKARQDKVLREAGFDPDAKMEEEGFIRSNLNAAYRNGGGMDLSVAAAGVLLVAVIILAGYLIISNVFRISVLKDMRMYGQLKTIGTTPRQLQKLLKKQADKLNLIGIPLGLVIGYFLGVMLLPVVMKFSFFSEVDKIRPRLWVFAAAAIFSCFTVWISCKKPAKMIAGMSPIKALHYQGKEESHRKVSKGRESRMRILQMAVSNIMDNKGKTLLVVVSISLSIILLNSVLNFTDSFDRETYIEGMSAADFIVSHESFGARSESKSFVLSREFIETAQKRSDLEENGSVYLYQATDDVVEKTRYDYAGIQTAKILTVNEEPYPEEFASALGKQLYAFDDGLFPKCKVVDGAIDMEKLATGRYIIEAITYINNNTDYKKEMFTLRPGDMVKSEIGGVTMEYEVMANVVINSGLLYSSSLGEAAVFILPSQEYLRQFPESFPIHYVMDAKEGQFDSLNTFLEEYEKTPLSKIKVESRASLSEVFQDLKATFSSTGTVLAVIFGVIGMLNLLNVTLTNAISRKQEFAIMQSIGMTRGQLRKLFVLEGVMYSVIGGGLSLLLSALLSLTAVKGLTQAYWFSIYRFTIIPAVILIPVYILLAIAIALIIDRIWNNGSVVERLRDAQ